MNLDIEKQLSELKPSKLPLEMKARLASEPAKQSLAISENEIKSSENHFKLLDDPIQANKKKLPSWHSFIGLAAAACAVFIIIHSREETTNDKSTQNKQTISNNTNNNNNNRNISIKTNIKSAAENSHYIILKQTKQTLLDSETLAINEINNQLWELVEQKWQDDTIVSCSDNPPEITSSETFLKLVLRPITVY